MSEYIGWLDDEWNIVLDHNQPIVRCRDCRYHGMKFQNSCEHPHALTAKGLLHVEPDGFCKWGEKED